MDTPLKRSVIVLLGGAAPYKQSFNIIINGIVLIDNDIILIAVLTAMLHRIITIL